MLLRIQRLYQLSHLVLRSRLARLKYIIDLHLALIII
jgi:hypothetical protein